MKRALLFPFIVGAFIAALWAGHPHAQFSGCQAGFCNPQATAAAGSTVLFDVSIISNSSSAGTSHSITMDIGSGPNGTTNRALFVPVMFAGANAGTSSAITVTWNGTSMGSPLGGPYANGTTGDIYLYGMISPATGLHNLAVSWTGTNQAIIAALSVVNADQTGGTTTFQNAAQATGSGATNSIALTGVSGSMCAAGHMSPGNFTAGNQTDIGFDDGANFWAAAANRGSGSSVNLTYTASGTPAWVSAGACIKGF